MGRVAVAGWALIIAMLLVWQGIALVRDDWPAISDMFRAIMRNPVGRWVMFGGWLWVGWHLFVRGWRFFLRG